MIRPNYIGIPAIVPEHQDELYRLVNERQALIDAAWRRGRTERTTLRKRIWEMFSMGTF